MPQPAPRWTADLVRSLPDDGNRYELVSGALVVTPAPRPRHQIGLAKLYDRIQPYLAESGLGMLLWSPADISLGEDEVLQPDLFVYEPRAGSTLRDWSDITALLLVMEVVSPGSARHDRQLKRRRYQRAGVPEYWVVDLDARIVERWRPEDAQPEILDQRLSWLPAGGTNPLNVDLVAFFSDVFGEA